MFRCVPDSAWAAANLAKLAWHVDSMVEFINQSQQIVSDLMGHPSFGTRLLQFCGHFCILQYGRRVAAMKLWDPERATPESMFCIAFLATIIVAKEPKTQGRWQFNGHSQGRPMSASKQWTIWRFFKTQKGSPSCLVPTLHWGFQEKREFPLFPN